jgi:hypothetical protein
MANKQVGFFNGNLGVGTKNPVASVHIDRNDAIVLPNGTTSQRPSGTTNGMMRYNTTNNNLEVYSQAKWVRLAEADAQSEFRLDIAPTIVVDGKTQPTWSNSVDVDISSNKIYTDELYLKNPSGGYKKITIDTDGNLKIE